MRRSSGSGGNMSGDDPRKRFLYDLPSSVLLKFCQVMDGLSDIDWTRFASEVLRDQTQFRWTERSEKRTDSLMNQWGSRNGRIGELVDLLESLQLLRARDIILSWMSTVKPSPPAPPSLSLFDPPPKPVQPSPTVGLVSNERGSLLPGPEPPPDDLLSKKQQPPQEFRLDGVVPPHPCANVCCSSAIMCWSYEQVCAGTQDFSPDLKVGEGGFGIVYRATLSFMDCAVKRLRQDCVDWHLLRRSFQTEVEKLSKFRHPNIVDLLGFSEGGGSMCLIYKFMENKSLEDQLHNECGRLSWPLRISVVTGAAAALQFLHCPPAGQEPLIHGDVKSSNILLDQHMVAKLSDFGLARYEPKPVPNFTATQTASVGKTTTVRGTLAYLPDEYVRKGELCTAVDVYSFGVVLLEVLTGRRALEKDKQPRETFLKELVADVEHDPNPEEVWRRQLDERLMTGGTSEPARCLEVAALACRSLHKLRKKRPAMTEVLERLQNIDSFVRNTTSSLHGLSCLDSSVEAVSQQLSKLGPLEQTCPPSQISSSLSSSSSSSFCALTPPNPLHSSSLHPVSSSFVGPCETDESRGFSQYDLPTQYRPNKTRCRHQSPSPAGPPQSQCSQPSVPTEDQYSFSLPIRTSYSSWSGSFNGATGTSLTEPKTRAKAGVDELSPAGSLQSTSPEPLVHVNPSKLRLLQKTTQYEEGQIRTPELLSSDIYGDSVDVRGPEESDDLDYLPAKHT